MRSGFLIPLLTVLLVLGSCKSSDSGSGSDIFSAPVAAQGLEGELPSLSEQRDVYEYPTFRNSDGTYTRVIWVETGLAKKLNDLLKNHPDWKLIVSAPSPQFFTDVNAPGNWKQHTGTEGLMITGPLEAVEKASDLIGWILRSQAEIVIESRVVEVQEGDELALGVNWFLQNIEDHPFDPNNPVGPLDPSVTLFNRAVLGRGIPPLPGFGGGGFVPSLIAELGTIQDGLQVDMMISALSSFTKVDVVNSPNIAVNDGHVAIIKAGQQVPFFTPQITGGNPIITTSFKDVSVQLQVVPRFLPPDTIRLTVKLEVSNVTGVSTVTFEGASITNPVISNRSATTTLDVPSGSTVVLGGLITNSKIEVEEKVPVLGDIPLLGIFFSNTHQADSRNNLIFFLKPKVIVRGFSESGEVILPPGPGEMDTPEKSDRD